jgi:sodium transport system permease protein
MNFHIVKTIFLKELKDTMRDSKTLIVMILLPILLYPLLAVGGGQILIKEGKKLQDKVAIVHISNADNKLYNYLKQEKKIKLVNSTNPKRDIREGKINVSVEIPASFQSDLEKEKKIPLKIYYDQANINSISAQAKVVDLLKEYKNSIVEHRIEKRGMDKDLLNPFHLSINNIAPKEKIGGFYLGNMLPFLIIFMTILGAFYPAIDQTAGEKERGTLETLLTTPVKKSEIITGKFLTISLFAFTTGLLNLGSMTMSMTMLLSSDKINFNIPFTSVGLIFLVLIPTTMFFVAIMMLVSSLANSFKDAQNYLTPVYLICGFPALVTVFPGFTLNFQTAIIPVANVSLLIKDVLLGRLEFDLIMVVLISTSIYSILAIAAATHLFNNEEVLLSEESNLKLLFYRKNDKLKKVPGFLEAITLYIITFGLLFYGGNILQAQYKLDGLLLTEILLVLVPALLFTKYLGFDIKETFSLKKVTWQSVSASILLALAGSFFILKFVDAIQTKFLPMPEEFKKAFEDFLMENGQPPSFLKLFLIIAVSAAVCEEILFRGPLMKGIRSKFSKTQTIIVVGILFGIFHLNIYKLIPTSVLGMLITYITISTGSIFNGMIFHLVNNGTAIILSSGDEGLFWLAADASLLYYPFFLACFILGIYLVINEEKKRKEPVKKKEIPEKVKLTP